MQSTKTVALFEDISGIGRCALSVAISVVSALGSQACPIPTAALSAHTGFGGVEPLDMTPFVKRAIAEWGEMGREFDCSLSGYMPSADCVDEAAPFMKRQKSLSHAVIVDPAMADDGKLYRSLKPDIVASYKNLCSCATVVTPNVTEARLLTGQAELEPILDALLALGCDTAIITGWTLGGDKCANVLKSAGEQTRFCEYRHIDARFPGTGDLLAACLAGYLNKGLDAFSSLERSTAFVRSAIQATVDAKTEPREGVLFEKALCRL